MLGRVICTRDGTLYSDGDIQAIFSDKWSVANKELLRDTIMKVASYHV